MNSRSIGRIGENIATKFLIDNGYKLLVRNYYAGYGTEIDIVAKSCNLVVFVEVKSSQGIATSDNISNRIGFYKRRALTRAARKFLYGKKMFSSGYSFRFDAIFIFYNGNSNSINHYKNIISLAF